MAPQIIALAARPIVASQPLAVIGRHGVPTDFRRRRYRCCSGPAVMARLPGRRTERWLERFLRERKRCSLLER